MNAKKGTKLHLMKLMN